MNLLFALLLIFSATPDVVAVHLADAQGAPIAGAPVSLFLYRFDAQGATAEEIPSGNCITDAAGNCEIQVPSNAPRDRSGFLRGALDVSASGRRAVLWPGGRLDVDLRLEAGQLRLETEAQPDEYATPGGVNIVQPRPALYLGGALLAVFFVTLALYLARRAKGS